MNNLNKIIPYMVDKDYPVSTGARRWNIVAVEGMNPDGTLNTDRPDRFNDLRLLIEMASPGQFTPFKEMIAHVSACTTEPGTAATFHPRVLARGGAFRIAFGHYPECWRVGFHKGDPGHPCLRQIPGSPVMGYRDFNRNQIRDKADKLVRADGINWHGTKPGWIGELVGLWSEGCNTDKIWAEHLDFMGLIYQDPRYLADKDFKFSGTVISGVELEKFNF